MAPQTMTVTVGDVVTFTWLFVHNVYLSANEADYNGCERSGGTMLADNTVTTYQHTFSSAGTFYFICEIPGHCNAGQKIAITAQWTIAPPSPTPT